jgi:outer membrane protein
MASMNYLKHLTLIVLLFAAISVHAQIENQLSLDDAINFAKENNTKIKNARLDEKTAREDVNEVISTGLPQITAGGSFTHNLQIATQLIPGEVLGQPAGTFVPVKFGTDYNVAGDITMDQLIFDGTFFLGLKAARQYQMLSNINTQKTEVDVTLETAKAYYMVLLTDQNQSYVTNSLSNTEKLFKETEKMYEEGLVEKLDVDRLKLAVSKLKVNLSDLKNQKKVVRQLLNYQMGRDVQTEVTLTDNLETVKQKLSTITESGNVENIIDYKLMQQQVILDSFNVKRYKVMKYPTVNLKVMHMQNAMENSVGDIGNNWFPNTLYTVSIKVPLFDGFGRKSKVSKAKIAQEKTQNNLNELRNGLILDQSNTSSTYSTALDNLKSEEENLKLAQDINKIATTKYKEGVGSSLELTTAQNDLIQVQVTYLNALYNALIAELNMKKSFGILN